MSNCFNSFIKFFKKNKPRNFSVLYHTRTENEIAEMRANNLKKYADSKAGKEKTVPEGVLPKEIMQDIEELDIPEGLLSKPQQAQPSLLGQQE